MSKITPESKITEDAAPPSRAAHHVLLIEDHIDALESLCMLLEIEGFDVTPCSTGMAALEAVDRGLRPAVALIDISLPDIDGFQVARRLRESFAGAACKLLALSGLSEDGGAEGEGSVFDDRLTKPVDIGALLKKLRDALA